MKNLVVRATLLVYILLTAISLNMNEAYALDCAKISTVEEAYGEYDGIIIGQVYRVSRSNDTMNEVRITVLKSYKGIGEKDVTLYENATWGNMHGPSEYNQVYLYYLQEIDGRWVSPLCSPSKKVDHAAQDLDFLTDKEINLEPGDAYSTDILIWKEPTFNYWVAAAIITLIVIGSIAWIWKAKRSNMR